MQISWTTLLVSTRIVISMRSVYRVVVVWWCSGVVAQMAAATPPRFVAERHAPGRRAFAVEGTAPRRQPDTVLTGSGEQVFEVVEAAEAAQSGKTIALDAVRVLCSERPAIPCSDGERGHYGP